MCSHEKHAKHQNSRALPSQFLTQTRLEFSAILDFYLAQYDSIQLLSPSAAQLQKEHLSKLDKLDPKFKFPLFKLDPKFKPPWEQNCFQDLLTLTSSWSSLFILEKEKLYLLFRPLFFLLLYHYHHLSCRTALTSLYLRTCGIWW